MKLAIMQPYLFPYIGYFQLMNAADKFVILDDVAYINKGWINRNNILINGQANLFTVPLKDASQNKLINSIELSDDDKWKSKLLKTIEMAYKKAPYYEPVYAMISKILFSDNKSISGLIATSFDYINSYLDINTQIIPTSAVYQNTLKAQEGILNICKQERTDIYINPIGGTELYSKELFAQHQIELYFLKSESMEYKQFAQPFVPWLSIIDVMMFNDIERIKVFLSKYQLV